MKELLYKVSKDDRWYLRLLHFAILVAGCLLVYISIRAGTVEVFPLVLGALLLAYWIFLRRPTK